MVYKTLHIEENTHYSLKLFAVGRRFTLDEAIRYLLSSYKELEK